MRRQKPRSRLARCALIAFLCALESRSLQARINPEEGAFYFQQYSSDVYGAAPQNWAVVQNNQGVMFFGNNDGVLEYDGATWQHISLKTSGLTVRSLAADQSGTVYVGSQNEFGYLKADSTGTLQYVSLVDTLKPVDRRFGDIWTVNVMPNGVLFSSEQRIFRWSAVHGMTVWKPATRFGRIYVVDGTPYVLSEGVGLLRIENDKLVTVAGGEIFSHDLSIFGVFRYQGLIVLAKPTGLYRYDGKKVQKLVTSADELMATAGIYACHVTKAGGLLVGTIRRGLLMLDSEGRLERVIDKSAGLASNSINAIYEDQEGDTWLAMNRGLAYIATELPLTQFGEREGVDEVVTAIQRQGGTLFAGTGVGLSRLEKSATGVPRFVPVKSFQSRVSNLQATQQSLFVAGQNGIVEVNRGGSEQVFNEDAVYDFSLSPQDPQLIYVAGRRGIYLVRGDGRHWRKVFEEPSEGQAFRSVLEDSEGDVWATTRSGVVRISELFRLTKSQLPKIERFTSSEGIPSGLVFAYRVGKQLLFGTPRGILYFDQQARRFRPFAGFGTMFEDGSHGVHLMRESARGDIWISGTGYQGILRPRGRGSYSWEENPLILGGVKGLYALYLDTDNVAWASGSPGGLVRYQVAAAAAPPKAFRAEIRNVRLLRGDQTIYGGSGERFATPDIKYQENSVRFRYAAPFFQAESRMEYQVRLDGLDRQWSAWVPETSKEYTNLGNRTYLFRVRARDLSGHVSAEDSFAFRILTPWYRSWWAYTLYLVALGGTVWLIVMWRVFALAERNRKLERIIHERTDEIRSQRDAIKMEEEKTEALLLNILPAPVADELRSTGVVNPTAYEDVTICFTDFVGFTLSSEKVSAADLVAGLHRYFTAFDEIVDRYGLEKMKTIGDSYMFVGGLPERKPSHAVDVVMAALEIIQAVTDLKRSTPHWDIRVGIHSGPVVAGVVGVRKFAFDIWGETVNFASRFESSGRPNRVNISARTNDLVKDFIACEARGPIPIKEGRLLEMFLASHVRSDLPNGDQDQSTSAFALLYEQKFGYAPRAIPRVPLVFSTEEERAEMRS